jgi:hypothetical protein
MLWVRGLPPRVDGIFRNGVNVDSDISDDCFLVCEVLIRIPTNATIPVITRNVAKVIDFDFNVFGMIEDSLRQSITSPQKVNKMSKFHSEKEGAQKCIQYCIVIPDSLVPECGLKTC